MKNKKLVYVLIPLVLIVWGAIIFRIFNTVNGTAIAPLASQKEKRTEEKTKFIRDTFSLKLNYRDPFLGHVLDKMNDEQAMLKIETAIPEVPVQAISWPKIVYGGLVKNQESNTPLLFVTINGKGRIMRVGDIVSNVELISNGGDSIEVQFEKQRRFIHQ